MPWWADHTATEVYFCRFYQLDWGTLWVDRWQSLFDGGCSSLLEPLDTGQLMPLHTDPLIFVYIVEVARCAPSGLVNLLSRQNLFNSVPSCQFTFHLYKHVGLSPEFSFFHQGMQANGELHQPCVPCCHRFHKQLAYNKYLADYIFAYLTYTRQVCKFLVSLTTLGIQQKLWVFFSEKCP